MVEPVSENQTANLRVKATTSFLSWVGEAVSLGIPVIIQKDGQPMLSAPLQKTAHGFKMLGLKEEELIGLAKAGEAAALYEKALSEKADKDKLEGLKWEHEALWKTFREDKQKTAEKWELNDQQMLAIFKNLTKI